MGRSCCHPAPSVQESTKSGSPVTDPLTGHSGGPVMAGSAVRSRKLPARWKSRRTSIDPITNTATPVAMSQEMNVPPRRSWGVNMGGSTWGSDELCGEIFSQLHGGGPTNDKVIQIDGSLPENLAPDVLSLFVLQREQHVDPARLRCRRDFLRVVTESADGCTQDCKDEPKYEKGRPVRCGASEGEDSEDGPRPDKEDHAGRQIHRVIRLEGSAEDQVCNALGSSCGGGPTVVGPGYEIVDSAHRLLPPGRE